MHEIVGKKEKRIIQNSMQLPCNTSKIKGCAVTKIQRFIVIFALKLTLLIKFQGETIYQVI